MPSSRPTVLALTLGDDDLASTRVRIGVPLHSLQDRGIETARVSARIRTWPIEFVAKVGVSRPSVTVIQKTVPPAWLSSVIARLSKRLVFECDDAIHLGYDLNPEDGARTSSRLRTLLPLCDRVIVSNARLGRDFVELGAPADMVCVFPGPAPTVAQRSPVTDRRGVIWLGSPSTFKYVESIVYPALELLPDDIQLTALGCSWDRDKGRVAERQWTMDRQAEGLGACHVGVAPQTSDEWSLRKAFYKVLEYLSAAVIPVVPDQEAIQTLLGEDVHTLAVTADNDTPVAWASAINQGLCRVVDDRWIAARDRVFEKWSADRLGEVLLG